jgi:hypothetical protein
LIEMIKYFHEPIVDHVDCFFISIDISKHQLTRKAEELVIYQFLILPVSTQASLYDIMVSFQLRSPRLQEVGKYECQ